MIKKITLALRKKRQETPIWHNVTNKKMISTSTYTVEKCSINWL